MVVLVISFLSSALSETEPWYSMHGTWAKETSFINQCYGSGSAWIRIKLKGRIRIQICIKVTSWIRIRLRINFQVKRQDVLNASLFEHFFEVKVKSRIRIRIEVKGRIWIRISVVRIRNNDHNNNLSQKIHNKHEVNRRLGETKCDSQVKRRFS